MPSTPSGSCWATVIAAASAALLAVAWWDIWVLLVQCGTAAVGTVGWLGVWYLRGVTVGELRLSPYDLRLRADDRDVHVPWEDVVGLSRAK